MIGARALRVEDPVLLRGVGRFAADTSHTGELHMRVVRSPVAHGRIERIATARALRSEGVAAVWTYDDIAELPAIGFRLTPRPEMLPYRQPALARGYVRYVGEPVAVVFASSAYLAEDAAELVELDIELRPPHIDADDDPVAWLEAEQATWAAGTGDDFAGQDSEAAAFVEEYGDVDAAFEQAREQPEGWRVVELDVRIGRHSGVPLECRGLVAAYDEATGQLVIDGAAKVPFWNRDAVAAATGLSPDRVLVRETHVGGGFGPRGELYPEDILVAVAAMRLRAPVKWVEDRQEHLLAANHSRDQHHTIRALVRASDGYLEALDDRFVLDQGAYVRTHGATVASLTASMLPGPYIIPNYRAHAHVRLTHKTPHGTYRSPGRYEGTFARERLIDRIAAELGLGREAVRRANFVPAEAMPYERPIKAMGTNMMHDSGNYALLFDRVSKHFDFPRIAAHVAARRAAGELAGFGYGFFVEKSGIGPAEGARLEVDPTGHVTLTCGASSVGQGVDTILTQVAAESLAVGHERVRVVRGRTDQFGYGRGAFSTRLSVMAGSAVRTAAENLAEKAKRVAAADFGVSVEELELRDGAVVLRRDPQRRVSLGALAESLEPVRAAELKESPGLRAEGWFRSDHMTYPYGLHAAVVRIEAATGRPVLERFIVGYDVGRALNPTLVEGQIAGGVAQGIGGALFEEFRYTEDGTPQSTTFMDYMIPTLAEIPEIDVLVTEDAPSPLNPLGVKGAGEGGTNAVAAAVASAIDDALQHPGAVTSVPVRPAELRSLLHRAESQPPLAPRPASAERPTTPLLSTEDVRTREDATGE